MRRINRNDECWCGSGKKYKRCHMEQDEALRKLGNELGMKIPRDIIKTPEQIEGIRKSGEITRGIFDLVEKNIKAGMTTDEINTLVHEYTINHDAIPAPLNYGGFPKSVCTSINEVVCHGIPSDRKLEEGDIINVDVTTIKDGYFSDSSRMYIIGEAKKEAVELVEAAKEALQVGMDAVKPYGFVGDIGEAIQTYAQSKGYSVVYEYGGHGIGVKFHEDPYVSHVGKKGEGMILLPGMVFTIEPMLNQGRPETRTLKDDWTAVTRDGKLSAQWEHTIVVTEDGYQILT
ncbi:methionyl aminopeptidase [Oceanirhabdus sp. W0125-5]|uniref:methionyl aminopeptidase n=1 Tax=Oceanirhabdus sp. W0125-5 TaxID=2999116 RepID=UPI0022F2E4D0|nr:methionyl aminopeptidase [Oceanirhabdus sp. W0125-5]WBW97685.1 methionyl aminopeptidase [Oceanirhabdus sp. W0125-5]